MLIFYEVKQNLSGGYLLTAQIITVSMCLSKKKIIARKIIRETHFFAKIFKSSLLRVLLWKESDKVSRSKIRLELFYSIKGHKLDGLSLSKS